jgi:hypothetical protein
MPFATVVHAPKQELIRVRNAIQTTVLINALRLDRRHLHAQHRATIVRHQATHHHRVVRIRRPRVHHRFPILLHREAVVLRVVTEDNIHLLIIKTN